MASFLRRLKQRLCTHRGKRVWDIHRLPDGNFRVRLYCPACGFRQDIIRDAEDVTKDAAQGNPEMLETLRRNLHLDTDETTDT